MYLYNFDITNQKIIEYNSDDSGAMITELYQPLLDFVNCDFTKYDLLRHKILQFIQAFENQFAEMDSAEVMSEIHKAFPDLQTWDIDNGETWWIARLCFSLFLQAQCELIFHPCKFTRMSIQDKGDCDFLHWQGIMQDKVKKIFDVDNDYFIPDFSPMCRLNYCFGETYSFNEITIIHPSGYEKFNGKEYDSFLIPFKEISDMPEKNTNINNLSHDNDYLSKSNQRQKYIKKHLHVVNGYKFNSLEEAFDCEIFKMAQLGIKLRRCKNCGKYFVFNPNKPARYCTNKLPNINMTCQQVASQKKYNKNIAPIQKAYINALKNKNKWYPSKKSGNRTLEQSRDYENWKKKTSAIRDEFQQKYDNAKNAAQKEAILDEFKQKLNL